MRSRAGDAADGEGRDGGTVAPGDGGMVVRLRAIGECAIEVGPTRVGPDAELAFAALLVLAMAGGHTVARRRLTELLWPGAPDARARHNLRQTLYKLRQLGAPVESESLHVRLAPTALAPHPLLDADGDGDGPEAAELLRADRPFGEFLAGYLPTFSAPFAAWVEEQRSVVHARLRRAALTRLHDERRRGDWSAVETLARKVLQLDGLNEEATLALAEATVMSGSKRAAIALLDAYLRDLGADAGDIRLPATLLRRRIAERLTPALASPDGDACFVGRAESMAFLHDQFRLARTAGARTVLVWGDAGIGKSRLATEFGRLAVLDGARLARVGCQARDVERPLSVFVDVVPQLLALPGAIGCSPESMAYLRRLTAYDPTVVEPAAETREAELLFAYVRRAILDLVDAVASESALVLVVEDVHWLDDASWRVLRELIGWLEGRRVLVVLTSRLPHATPTRPARGAAGVVEHRLAPLDRAASLALFDAATSGVAAPAEYREWCVEVADGNPLFLSELARGASRGGQPIAPASVERLIADRIARLSDNGRRALQCSAILGRHSTVERLATMLGLSTQDVVGALTEGLTERLIEAKAGALVCRHSLVETICIRSLRDVDAVLLHRLAALALEADVGDEWSAPLAWACVQHWLRAAQPDRALRAAVNTATRLIALGLPRDAASMLDDIAAQCGLVQPTADYYATRRDALHSSGEWSKLSVLLAGTERPRRADASDCDEVAVDGLLELEARLRTGGDAAAVLAIASRHACDRNARSVHRIESGILALRCADNLFDSAAAHGVFSALSPLFRLTPTTGASARLLAIFHNGFGDIAKAVEATEEWLAAERRQGNPLTLSRALRNAAIPYRTAGEIDTAFAAARESYDVAARLRLASSAANSADMLATMNLTLGDCSQAQRWHAAARDWARQADEPALMSSLEVVSLRLAIASGSVDELFESSTIDIGIAMSDRLLRRKADRLALLADVALARHDGLLLRQLVSEMRQLHEVARTHHGHDYAASVLIRAVLATSGATDATGLASEYIALRREQGPLSAQAAHAISLLERRYSACGPPRPDTR